MQGSVGIKVLKPNEDKSATSFSLQTRVPCGQPGIAVNARLRLVLRELKGSWSPPLPKPSGKITSSSISIGAVKKAVFTSNWVKSHPSDAASANVRRTTVAAGTGANVSLK
jgi:hypothetical protein